MSSPLPADQRIVERYMPAASDAEKDAARKNLRALARVLVRIARRLAQDASDNKPRAIVADTIEWSARSRPPL